MTVLAFIIGVIVLVVGLAVSIALHEMGHLLPAKAFGVRVGQYMIGFGPTLWSRRIGNTEYGFKAIPAGGYISMSGMYPPSAGAPSGESRADGFFRTMVQDARVANDETIIDPEADAAGPGQRRLRAFYELPVYKRIIVMLGGPVMNLVLAIIIFTILFTGIGVQTATTTIASVNQCVLPATSTSTTCTSADPVSPAAEAGILPGDRIVSVAGTPVSTFAEASAIVQASPGKALPFVVERAGHLTHLTVTPLLAERKVIDKNGEPVTAKVGFVGMLATSAFVSQPLWTGPETAIQNVGQVAAVMWQLPARVYQTAVDLVTGAPRDPNGPLSVVGAGRLAGEVAATDAPITNRVAGILSLLGSLNIALFVFNLLPLLPLDGGHVVVALWDGIKRVWARLTNRGVPRPVDATRLVPVTFVVVIALVVMGGVLILADVFNPVSLTG